MTDQISTPEAQAPAILKPTVVTGFEGQATLMSPPYLDHLQRVAKMFLSASMTPDHFKPSKGWERADGKMVDERTEAQALADIAIVLDMANQLDVRPFQMLQNVFVIGGRPGLNASLVVSLVNTRGVFKGPIRYEIKGSGESLAVTAWAIEKSDGGRVEATVTMALAHAEGWTKRKINKKTKEEIPSKYDTMPERMLQYRAAVWLVRTYHPEVLLGLHTKEELEDAGTLDAEWTAEEAPARTAQGSGQPAPGVGPSKAAARLLQGG